MVPIEPTPPFIPLSKIPDFDPRSVPVVGIDAHLPPVDPRSLRPDALRARFERAVVALVQGVVGDYDFAFHRTALFSGLISDEVRSSGTYTAWRAADVDGVIDAQSSSVGVQNISAEWWARLHRARVRLGRLLQRASVPSTVAADEHPRFAQTQAFDDLLAGHLELELAMNGAGGQEDVDAGLLGVLQRLPSPVDVALVVGDLHQRLPRGQLFQRREGADRLACGFPVGGEVHGLPEGVEDPADPA